MRDLLIYGLPTAAVVIIALCIRFWPDRGPRCHCGRPATRLASDGQFECDGCIEARLGGKAPEPKRNA